MSSQRPKPKASPSKPPGKRGSPRSRKRAKRSKGATRWTWTVRIAALGLFLASAAVLTATAIFSYYARDLPTVDSLRAYSPPQITRVLDRKGRLIGELFEERRTVVPMERIPRVLVLSVLAAEDADFYRHKGLDYTGVVRALLRDLLSASPLQGASTVTQQIVKNLLLTPERTVSRKIRELILARRLEQKLDKDQILFLYLNHIFFGHGRYGVQEASRFYFGKNVEDIGLAEASLLAGIPQAPSRYSPLRHPEAARKRQLYVLGQLEAKREAYWDDLPLKQIRAARKAEIRVAPPQEPAGQAPEIMTLVRRSLRKQFGEESAARGGYTVETSIDLELQASTREALRKGLIDIDRRQKRLGPLRVSGGKRAKPRPVERLRTGRTYDAVVTGTGDHQGIIHLDVGGHSAITRMDDVGRFNPQALPASRFAAVGARVRVSVQQLPRQGKEAAEVRLELGPQGAVVVIDPRSRDVLALVGGDTATFGFNRAVDAVRQPGSAFKPVVYALALGSKRFTPASLVLDAPEVFEEWKPNNYETWNYQGAVRLREALAQSINLVAVRVTREMTPGAVVDFARRLGFTSDLEPTLAIGLGASSVRPIELVNAYATFAAGGRWKPPRFIKRIEDSSGRTLPLPQTESPRAVLTPAAAYLTTSLLTSVIQDGTGRAASSLGRPAAGKTGTSNRARDTWFVGYTPEVVVGVWVGYDDYRPLGKGESGAKSALPIWMAVVSRAVKGKPVVDFPVPSGVVAAQIDPQTGLLAYEGMQGSLQEVFLTGTAPTEMARPPDVLDAKAFLVEQLGGHARDAN